MTDVATGVAGSLFEEDRFNTVPKELEIKGGLRIGD
jgi:hypothetical protein